MKTIETGGITYISLIPGGTSEWYFGISYEHGDLYEAEEIFKSGHEIVGRNLCLIHYPDGQVYRPVPKERGVYPAEPVYLDGYIYILSVNFPKLLINVISFDCTTGQTAPVADIPLDLIKDCYNLSLSTAPLTVTRQCVMNNEFEIIWPERAAFEMGDHDSYFLRQGDRLFFSRWHEEGDGADYRYWEETVIRGISGEIIEVLDGDVRIMPDGEMWHLI